LPSITTSYLYTFIALIAISSLLIFSFMAYVNTLCASSETRQLKNLMDHVTAKSIELLTLTLSTNATSESFLITPASIGHKQYWLQFRNDSTKTWLEGGLGDVRIEGTELSIYLPKNILATGHYIGGYGSIHLKCYLNKSIPQIFLKDQGGSD